VDTYPGKMFPGTITAINPLIDTTTRNVQIRATLANPDRVLVPGMYATVEIAAGAPQRFVTLPQTAISYNSYGDTVFIVDDKGKDAQGKSAGSVRQVFVTTGLTRGDQVAIATGVKDGETVVSAGQMKLRNGSAIIVDNTVEPKSNPNPVPVDQ
jgi:membrane fusion protein (multidrug efflux system)